MFLTAALESLNSLFSASLDEWKEASKAQKVEKLSLPSPSKVLKSKLTQVYEKEPQIDELLNSIAMIRKDLMGRQAAGSGGAATSNPRSSTVQTGIVRNSIQPKQSITGTRTARFPTFDFPSIKRIDARNTLSKPTEESKETVIPVKVDNPNGKAEEIKALPTPQIANVVVPVVDVKAVAPIAEPPKEVIEKVAVQTSKPETQAPTTILEPTTAPITIPSPKSLVFKPTSVAETTSPIISVEDSIDLNVSMDLDLGLELVHPRVSIDPLTIPISKSQVPANIYHGNATSFLPPNVQKQVINDKPVTFIPSTYTKAKERAKPVIAALKTAELAAKRVRRINLI